MLAPANKTNRCWMILILFWFASVFLVEHKVCMKLWLIDHKIHQKSPLLSHNVIRSKECLRWKMTKGKKVNSYLNSKRSKIGRQWCIIITFNIFFSANRFNRNNSCVLFQPYQLKNGKWIDFTRSQEIAPKRLIFPVSNVYGCCTSVSPSYPLW